MRVATWNVDSAKQRLPRLLPWLDERQPDVVCLQKTKLVSAAFDELLAGGYAVARHEEAQWNGVAILSRSGLEEVTVGIPALRGPHREARALSAALWRHPRPLGLRSRRADPRLRVVADNRYGLPDRSRCRD